MLAGARFGSLKRKRKPLVVFPFFKKFLSSVGVFGAFPLLILRTTQNRDTGERL